MSRERVELVRRLFDALNRRDVDEAVEQCVHPDMELHSLLAEAEGEVYRGHDGFRRWFQLMVGVFPDWHADVDLTRDTGEVLLCANRLSGRGASSGVPVERTFWYLAGFRDGRVASIRFFGTEHEALEALSPRE